MQQIEKITLLYEISRALAEHLNLKKSLYKVLDILSNAMQMVRGTVTILDLERGKISIQVTHSLSPSTFGRINDKPDKSITDRVIQTGNPLIIPKISQEPLFLNHTTMHKRHKGDHEISSICVPIQKEDQVIGTLSMEQPFDPDDALKDRQELLSTVAAIVAHHVIKLEAIQCEKKQLHQENKRLRQELENRYRIKSIVGNSNKMQDVFQMISQVCRSNATVLVRGESGTGKKLVASSVHYNSQRAKGAFIKVNCAAIPSNLIESELFGHEKNAFTSAIKKKLGKFELAHKGTIFLDEIGSIGLDVQIKLLRVLREKEFERIGGQQTIKTDVRIIAATSKNLEKTVEQGTFRADLYYHLNIFPIYMPPLRARKTDVLLLADFFLNKYNKKSGKSIKRFSTPAIDMLMDYHWPGNVRELENCIERATVLCEGGVIHSYHLPPTLQTGRESNTLPHLSLEDAVANLEREMIIDSLKNTSGNITAAAQVLKTTVRKFSYKAKRYGVDYRDFR